MSEKARELETELWKMQQSAITSATWGRGDVYAKPSELIDQAVAPLVEALIGIQGLTHGGDSDIYQIAGEALKGWKE